MTELRLWRARNYNRANPQQKRQVRGVPRAIAAAWRRSEFMVVPNSRLVTDAVEPGVVDVAFMPVDDEHVGHTKWPPTGGHSTWFGIVRAEPSGTPAPAP